jgi:hypothetical protein
MGVGTAVFLLLLWIKVEFRREEFIPTRSMLNLLALLQ